MNHQLCTATFLLYLSIFIEKILETDSFSQEEEQSITNIALYASLVATIIIDNNYDLTNIKTALTKSLPSEYHKLAIDTTSDLLTLSKETEEALEQGYKYFHTVGDFLLRKLQRSIVIDTAKKTLTYNDEEVFSTAMFTYEAIMLLDQHNYDTDIAIQSLEEDDDNTHASILEVLTYVKEHNTN